MKLSKKSKFIDFKLVITLSATAVAIAILFGTIWLVEFIKSIDVPQNSIMHPVQQLFIESTTSALNIFLLFLIVIGFVSFIIYLIVKRFKD